MSSRKPNPSSSRAQRRWTAAAESEYRRIVPGKDATRVVVEAGPGELRRARRLLRVTGRDFAQVVSRRGDLVCVVNNWDGPFWSTLRRLVAEDKKQEQEE